jgi:hypothetical protein
MKPARRLLMGILIWSMSSTSAVGGWFCGSRPSCESQAAWPCPTTCVPLCRVGPLAMVPQPSVVYLEPVAAEEPKVLTRGSSPTGPGRRLVITPTAYEWNPSTLGNERPCRGGSPILSFDPQVATQYPIFAAGGGGGWLGGGGSSVSASTDPSGPLTSSGGPIVVGFASHRFDLESFPGTGTTPSALIAGIGGAGSPGPGGGRASGLIGRDIFLTDSGPAITDVPSISPGPGGTAGVVPEPPAAVSTLIGLTVAALVSWWRLSSFAPSAPRSLGE